MAMLREELGEEVDNYAPCVNGGVSLSKLCGVMHDTCNSANSIARAVRVLRDDSGRDLYSEAEWQRMQNDHERNGSISYVAIIAAICILMHMLETLRLM